MSPFRKQYDEKVEQLEKLKKQWDDGPKSEYLRSQVAEALTVVEGLEIAMRGDAHRKIVDADGPVGGSYARLASASTSFNSFGEMLQCVQRAGTPGGQTDSRLFETRAATGMSEAIGSDGGFVLPSTFSEELMHDAFETGLLAKRCRRFPITRGNTIEMPGIDETSRVAGSRWGGIRGYWADEATEKTASKPKFRRIKLEAHKMVGLAYLTDELLEDSAAMESYVRQAFADEFGFMMDDAILRGTGAGMPKGILTSSGTVSIAGSGGATTVVYADVISMWSRLIGSARADSVWLINQSVEPQLFQMSLTVGSGGSAVYLPAGGASASPYGTLFGRPVIPCEQCSQLGTTGDIILGNFRRGYILGEKGGMQSDMSIHVRFVYDESVIRFVLRWDGSPLLTSPITPYKGSATLGNFVKLDTRS